MIAVGLTGGIGSGKSTVAELLTAYGAVVVDADVLAREAVAPGTRGLDRVIEEFGPGVLAPDGSLDRPRLAALVFGNPQRLAALNAIVHPYVAARRAELTAAAAAIAPDAVVVFDVPLLVENGLARNNDYDVIVVVDASTGTRLRRLVDERGMDEDQARARMAAQAGREDRLEVADVVIDNDGDLAHLQEQVDVLWARLHG